MGVPAYLGKLFSFGDLFVNLLGEVLVRLEDLAVGHGGEFGDLWLRGGLWYSVWDKRVVEFVMRGCLDGLWMLKLPG